jgi:crotonobetainyl-CoA:carnitine CoA-transferase CaiB-like acyl-CoA transferase
MTRSSRALGFADIQSQPVTNRPQMIRTIVCDKTTAVFTAQAVSSALYAREKTGQGDPSVSRCWIP